MINLLPPEYKENILYARRNRTLLNWVSAIIGSLLLLAAISACGYILLNNSIKDQTVRAQDSQQHLKAEKIDETKSKLKDISSNTKLILQVLSREVLFSKLLKQLGASLPAGTTLQSIEINKLQGGITLKALATNVQTATQIQVNLSDPQNKIFQKADIESINCVPTSTNKTIYPCTVQLRALFAKNNPYTYINPNSQSPGGGQ